jgi:hypothetical protein
MLVKLALFAVLLNLAACHAQCTNGASPITATVNTIVIAANCVGSGFTPSTTTSQVMTYNIAATDTSTMKVRQSID